MVYWTDLTSSIVRSVLALLPHAFNSAASNQRGTFKKDVLPACIDNFLSEYFFPMLPSAGPTSAKSSAEEHVAHPFLRLLFYSSCKFVLSHYAASQ